MQELEWERLTSFRPFSVIAATGGLDQLKALRQVRRYRNAEHLLTQGEEPRAVHVLLDGTLELFFSHNGDVATVEIVEAPFSFPLEATVASRTVCYSVRSVGYSTSCTFPAAAIRGLSMRYPEFASAMAEMLAEQQSRLLRDLISNKVRNSQERLAAWVLNQYRRSGGNNVVRIGIKKSTLASYLGMAPENLSRAFNILERHGVRREGRSLHIDSPDALERLCQSSHILDG